ncbi:VOC family protein [Streptomyces natalensis]|uniref:Hydroxylase n=1 Tax=Streptomyces natalensis ATCC 27448 TaxID=1240678 RepID=A0A0D7CF80_9ACTN|nr:VOC family protein [Streptomyces natalensis]KIZ14899.1 hydroxylase [Streptomyces natalensis ATCC 27448]
MITTDFVPGSPCWLDLGARDVESEAAFYRAVFDWQAAPYSEEPDGYTLFRLDGKVVGAVGPLTEAGARPAWTIYFNTPDADATIKVAEQAGGAVRTQPAEVGATEGRFAQLTDPQGAEFAIWQPGRYPGLELTDAPGSLGWVELFTTDSAAAQAFYRSLFGWTTQEISLPGGGGAYTLIGPEGAGEERMHGGIMGVPPDFFESGGKPYWHPVFGTADCDATVGLVTRHGGAVSMGPQTAEGVGRLAVCTDPTGAEFVVLRPQEQTPEAAAG